MKKAGSPQSYPALRRRSEREILFARPLANKLMCLLGLVLFGGGTLAVLLVPSAFGGSFWARALWILLAGIAFCAFFTEVFHMERLSIDLERRTWNLRRGITGFIKSRAGDLEELSHLSLESEPWESDDSPAFTLWSVWVHFSDPGIDRYCLGVRPRGLEDFQADNERQARDLLDDLACALGLPADEDRRSQPGKETEL